MANHHHHRQSHYAGDREISVTDIKPAAAQGLERSHELFGIQRGMEMLRAPSEHNSSHIRKTNPHQDYTNHAMMSPWQVAGLFTGGGDVTTSSSSVAEQCNGRGFSLSLYNNMDLYPSFQIPQQQREQQQQQQQPFEVKNSKYLEAAEELLNECCSLRKETEKNTRKSFGKGVMKWEEEVQPSNSSLYFKDVIQLQEIKSQLLQMLEKIDKRYRKYREQMNVVVSSFEAVAGEGTTEVYSALAAKAMSRHFRRLKDSIVAQIRVVKSAMGEKGDGPAPRTTRGETPGLKVIDRCVRQQKLYQQGLMEQHPWRPQRGLPERAVSMLRAWLFEHFLHPYPNEVDKFHLAKQTGLTKSQVSNWFINARVRLWKPMVEEMYLEEMKESETPSNTDASMQRESASNAKPGPSLSFEEKLFPPMQLLNEPEPLSSLLNISHHHHGEQISDTDQDTSLHPAQHQLQSLQVMSRAEDIGYSTGADHTGFSYNNHNNNNNTWNGVSLTLGLHQHNGGMSLPFPSTAQNSFLFPREHIGDGSGEAETLSYGRNFMGAQLLDHMAG